MVSGHVVRGEDNTRKIRQFITIFHRADFISRKRFLWAFLGVTAREKQFQLLAYDLTLTGQLKRLIWIQTDMILSDASA